MNVPANYKYTKEHEWILIEGNTGKIGITDFAQSQLGDIVFVDINSNLTEIKAGESFGTIEAVKTVSELYAPCSGKVIEINKKINDSPEVINTDPYGEGWMIKIELTNLEELNNLLDSEAYSKLIAE